MRVVDAVLLGIGCVAALVAGFWSSSGGTTQHAAPAAAPAISVREGTSNVLQGLCMYSSAAFVIASVLLGIYTDRSATKGAFRFAIVGILTVVIGTVPAASWAVVSIGCGGEWSVWLLWVGGAVVAGVTAVGCLAAAARYSTKPSLQLLDRLLEHAESDVLEAWLTKVFDGAALHNGLLDL
jgi:hypothetical protein